MKKLLTLGALGLFASFGALAQPTLNGRIEASEKGNTIGKYQSLGQYTNPRGFGDWGMKEAFVAEDANFLYVAINGTVEGNGNAFQIFFNVPARAGVAACTALPAATPAADPTSFQSMTAALEMEVDAGVAYRAPGGIPQLELADYTLAAPASQVLMPMAGTTFDDQGSAGTFLAGAARAAYKTSADGKVTSNVDEGFEFAVNKAAYGMVAGTPVQIFVLMNNGDGGFLSTDFIPQAITPNGNLGTGPDFCLDVDGQQFVTYTIGSPLSAPKLAANAINFTVSPNPVSGQDAAVEFTVADKAQAGSVIVTDLLGRTVATLANGTLSAGTQRYSLRTAGLSAGNYIVKLQLGDKVATRKVSVL